MKKTSRVKINTKTRTRLKQGDEVIVIAGKDKGKRGTIQKVLHRNNKVKFKISGVNKVKKHVRANPQNNEQGGIVSQEAFIDASNVMIFNPNTQKGSRIAIKVLELNRKVRCFKSKGQLTEIEA